MTTIKRTRVYFDGNRWVFEDINEPSVHLQTLSLTNNRLSSISDIEFSGLPQLDELYLDKNLLVSITDDAFYVLAKLTLLRLDSNKLSDISHIMFSGLLQLKKLYLQQNQIASVADFAFCRLSKLALLDLGENQLSSISNKTFAGLVQLEKLYLGWNRLVGIDDGAFSELSNLQQLSLVNNEIAYIAKGAFSRQNLLHKNETGVISLDHFSRLKNLLLWSNKLEYIPPAICYVESLIELAIYDNMITNIQQNCFPRMINLRYLIAHHNRIRRLTNGVFNKQLQILDLGDNMVEELNNYTFPGSLTSINLANNSLTTLDNHFWSLFKVLEGQTKNISLNGNSIVLHSKMVEQFVAFMNADKRSSMHPSTVYLFLSNQTSLQRLTNIIDCFDEAGSCAGIMKNSLTRLHIYHESPYYYCDCHEYKLIRRLRENQLKLFGGFSVGDLLSNVHCNNLTHNSYTDKGNVTAATIQYVDMTCQVPTDCPSGCQCINRPYNETMHVQCSNTNLQRTPPKVPEINAYTLDLDFSHNKGLLLERRQYFQNTSILDLSNCSLTSITYETWKSMDRIKFIYLHDNLLTSIPELVMNVNYSSLQGISVYNNNWDCSCGNIWIKIFFISIKDRLMKPLEIVCRTPTKLVERVLLSVGENEFCIKSTSNILAVTLSVAGFGVFALCLAFSICYILRVRLYTAWHMHPFDLDECQGEEMEYDVFICGSFEDDTFCQEILELLESKGYNCCYHVRDFHPGDTIFANMARAINKSKRTIFFLSEHFVDSQYCMFEFEFSLTRDLRLRKKRTIIAVERPIDLSAEGVSESIKFYLSRYTYLDMSSRDYQRQLLYAMPVHKLGIAAEENRERGADIDLQPNIPFQDDQQVYANLLNDDDTELLDDVAEMEVINGNRQLNDDEYPLSTVDEHI